MDKDRFDALMKLAEFRMGIREARRTHEFRVSLGLWVGMGAGVISLRGVPSVVLMVLLPLVVLGHAWFWVRWNWIANERDARLAYFHAESAELLLFDDVKKPSRRSMSRSERAFGFFTHGPPLFQILATILLAVGLALFAVQEVPNDSRSPATSSEEVERVPDLTEPPPSPLTRPVSRPIKSP